MQDLEYRIGKVSINKRTIVLNTWDPDEASHKFIVRAKDKDLYIYISEGHGHGLLRRLFQIPEKEIVGGGNVYIDNSRYLILDQYSGMYKGIPNIVAQKFADLIYKTIDDIDIKGVKTDTNDSVLNSYWEKK